MKIVTACAALAVAVSFAAGCSSAPSQPLTARQVAARIGAAGFTDCGAHPLGGVTDAGVAYLHGRKIGIDTFPGPDIRDQWEGFARNYGVVPISQGDTWVAYNSTEPTVRGC